MSFCTVGMRHMWEDRNVLSQTSRKMETPEDVEVKKKMQQAQLMKWHHWRTHLSQPFKHIRKKEMPNTSPTFKIVQASLVAKAHSHGTLTSPMVNPSPWWWNTATELACPDLMFRDEYKSFGWTWTKNWWTKIITTCRRNSNILLPRRGNNLKMAKSTALSRSKWFQLHLSLEGQQWYNTCAMLFCAKVLQRIPAAGKATQGKTEAPR